MTMEAYHLRGSSIAWSYQHRYSRNDVIVNPPDYVVERYGHKLDRLDNGEGQIPRDYLQRMSYDARRRIAEAAETDAVDEDSSKEEIVEVIGYDPDEDGAQSETVEERAAEIVSDPDPTADAIETTAPDHDANGPSQEDVEQRKQEIRDGYDQIPDASDVGASNPDDCETE